MTRKQIVSRRLAVSLLELLVSITIVLALAQLTLVGVSSAREAARRSSCLNNLRQVGMAILCFEQAAGKLPSGKIEPEEIDELNPWGWGFATQILEHLEEPQRMQTTIAAYCPRILLDAFENRLPSPYSNNIPLFSCPSDQNAGLRLMTGPGHGLPNPNPVNMGPIFTGSYLGVSGTTHKEGGCLDDIQIFDGDGVLFTDSRIRLRDVVDGQSQTLLAGERGVPNDLLYGWLFCSLGACDPYLSSHYGLAHGWSAPTGSGIVPYGLQRRFWSYHTTVNFTRVDGSVVMLGYDTDRVIFMSMCTRLER